VAAFYTADGDCSHHGEWRGRLQNSFHPDHSGDIFFSYAPGYVEDYGEERGVSYGSVYNYDAQVPLILYGPPFAAGTFEQTVEPVDIAPTLARILGLPQPSASTGRVLAEALVPEPRQRK
jgi:arylsulfatase A-like enzyme